MSLREVCKCGHDKATHYRDPQTGQVGACTGLGCNVKSTTCAAYRPEDMPSEPPPKPGGFFVSTRIKVNSPGRYKPHANPKCACEACRYWAHCWHPAYCSCLLCR